MIIDFYNYSDESLAQIKEDLRAEMDLRVTLKSHLAELDYRKEQLSAIGDVQPVREFAPVPYVGHLPGAHVIIDGNVWINVSGAPLSVSPQDYPQGWSKVLSPDEDILAWEAGIPVDVGDVYMYLDKAYTVLQSHTTQEGWEPPGLPSLWTPAVI